MGFLILIISVSTARGFGMTLQTNDSSLDWKESELDLQRFVIIKGQDGTGNLYTNWKEFVTIARNVYTDGVDLVTGDGGIDVDKGEVDTSGVDQETPPSNDIPTVHTPKIPTDAAPVTELSKLSLEERPVLEEGFVRQEFLSSRLLLTQLLTALAVLRPGGNLVCKVFDTVTELSAQLLYITCLTFDSVSLFKPLSSRPANSERYLVAKGKKDNVSYYIDLLDKTNESYLGTKQVINIFSNELPPDFKDWLYGQNMLSVDRQTNTGRKILDILAGKEIYIPEYDLRKPFILFNIPDNPAYKRSKIHVYQRTSYLRADARKTNFQRGRIIEQAEREAPDTGDVSISNTDVELVQQIEV